MIKSSCYKLCFFAVPLPVKNSGWRVNICDIYMILYLKSADIMVFMWTCSKWQYFLTDWVIYPVVIWSLHSFCEWYEHKTKIRSDNWYENIIDWYDHWSHHWCDPIIDMITSFIYILRNSIKWYSVMNCSSKTFILCVIWA